MSVQSPIYQQPAWQPPGPENPYGPIVSGFEVEQALATLIREWMPDYLRALESQRGLPDGKLPNFKTEVPTSFDADRLREDQLPALSIIAPGMTERPEVHGDGTYFARWQADCVSVCSGAGNRQARRLAQWYTAALRALVVQHQQLDPTELTVIAVDPMGELYTTRSPTEERTLGEGVARFVVHVAGVTYRDAGPWPLHKAGEDATLTEALTHDIDVLKI